MRNLNSVNSRNCALHWSLLRQPKTLRYLLPRRLQLLHLMNGSICTLEVQPRNPKLKPSSDFNRPSCVIFATPMEEQPKIKPY